MDESSLVQGSPEWIQSRIGSVGASRVQEVIARTKTGYGASRANYMAELICERLTGEAAERFMSAPMQWGIDHEPDARAAYEFFRDASVTVVGKISHPTILHSHASPDGLVGDDGLVEIKCPSSATHLDTLLSQTVPAKYVTQMLWQMACTERQWCDFVSYDPRLPESMSLFVKRVERDETAIAGLEKDVSAFLAELADKLSKLNSLYGLQEAA